MAIDEGFLSYGVVALDEPGTPVGDHHHVLVTDLNVGIPTVIGKQYRDQHDSQLISPLTAELAAFTTHSVTRTRADIPFAAQSLTDFDWLAILDSST